MKWNRLKFLVSTFLLGFIACSDDNSAGVTEDGNPAFAQGESSSSVGSSSSETAVSPKFDLWDGSIGDPKSILETKMSVIGMGLTTVLLAVCLSLFIQLSRETIIPTARWMRLLSIARACVELWN